MRGEKHPNYKDGSGSKPYSKDFNERLKEEIRSRDNYTCQNCGMADEEHIVVFGSSVEVHHIDYNKQNTLKNNLITLCKPCNVRANYNIKIWKEYYTKKMQIGNIARSLF
jgi:hypothetical protein